MWAAYAQDIRSVVGTTDKRPNSLAWVGALQLEILRQTTHFRCGASLARQTGCADHTNQKTADLVCCGDTPSAPLRALHALRSTTSESTPIARPNSFRRNMRSCVSCTGMCPTRHRVCFITKRSLRGTDVNGDAAGASRRAISCHLTMLLTDVTTFS